MRRAARFVLFSLPFLAVPASYAVVSSTVGLGVNPSLLAQYGVLGLWVSSLLVREYRVAERHTKLLDRILELLQRLERTH